MADETNNVPGFLLQDNPRIYVSSLLGRWLLERTTPSWRIVDPEKGFQRVVRESRAREIALAVLDQSRTFPNAIVLATDVEDLETNGKEIIFPNSIRFMVVDGQHRLWAQRFSDYEAEYACMIHLGLSERDMAELFLEINDNQKRVPSSLRWDLVRLVRPEDDPYSVEAAEIVYLLATEDESPLFQRIDLTGEQSEIQLKQGSLAPEIRRLVGPRSPLKELSFDDHYHILVTYFSAVRELDREDWGSKDSPFYRARVIRALIRLIPDVLGNVEIPVDQITALEFLNFLERIDPSSLDPEEIRAAQGSAGIKAIYDQLKAQVVD
jgi:DNA sulfur modification protein DndB